MEKAYFLCVLIFGRKILFFTMNVLISENFRWEPCFSGTCTKLL